MRRAQHLPLAAVCLLAIAVLTVGGCGPRTIVSMIFPKRYTVTTVVDFTDGATRSRQTVVSECRVVDQTDSVANNFSVTVTGERHWIRRADGSLWVIGLLDPCRWMRKGPGFAEGFAPIRPEGREKPRIWDLRHSLTYRFDDPADPTRLDAWRTQALFEGGADGLRLSAQLAPTGKRPADTLTAVFPFLAKVQAEEAARKSTDSRQKTAAMGSFFGVVAEALQLHNLRCDAPDPDAPGPIRLEESAVCDTGQPCPPNAAPDRPCNTPVGGLEPEISDDFKTVGFRLDRFRPGYLGAFLRADRLQAAGAPGLWGPYAFSWQPKACVDGLCMGLGRFDYGRLYYPSRNILVTVHQGAHGASPVLYLARPGPVWGGEE